MGLLRRLLAGKRVVPPVPQGRIVVTGTIEAQESPKRRTKVSGSSCFIEYTGADGIDSARTITLRRIDGPMGAPHIIGAHCHARDAYRSFRIDRIRTMVDCVSGEVLDPVGHCIALQRAGLLKVQDKALEKVMIIMSFVARCDGDFDPREQEALDDVLGRYFRFFGGDDETYERARREVTRLAPDADDVMRALRWIKRAPNSKELASFTLTALVAVMDADRVHSDEEVYWALELGEELRRLAGR